MITINILGFKLKKQKLYGDLRWQNQIVQIAILGQNLIIILVLFWAKSGAGTQTGVPAGRDT
jgi:hypothetical protein